MTRSRSLTLRATLALPLAFTLTVAAAACSSRQNDVAFSQGGESGLGGSPNQGGSGTAGESAGATQAGSAAAGANSGAGSSAGGGKSSGGASSAGTTSVSAGSPGEAGGTSLGGASPGGAASTGCDEGCTELCEGGMCMCSCPTTTLKCPNTVQTLEASFASACQMDDDCFGAEHYTGCCRVTVVGLNVSQHDGFTAWEKDTCHGPPACGCAIDTLTADDGKMIKRDMSYAVHCVAGKCATWIP